MGFVEILAELQYLAPIFFSTQRQGETEMSEIFHYSGSSGVKPITIQMTENF